MRYSLILILALAACQKPEIKTVSFEQRGNGDFFIQDGNLVTDFMDAGQLKITRPFNKGRYYKAIGHDVRIYFNSEIVAKGALTCEK